MSRLFRPCSDCFLADAPEAAATRANRTIGAIERRVKSLPEHYSETVQYERLVDWMSRYEAVSGFAGQISVCAQKRIDGECQAGKIIDVNVGEYL